MFDNDSIFYRRAMIVLGNGSFGDQLVYSRLSDD